MALPSADRLKEFAEAVLSKVGVAKEISHSVAEILVEADLLGHTTHGLQLLPAYVREINAGTMRKEGHPERVRDEGDALTWDADYLPGPWVVKCSIEAMVERLDKYSVVTSVIRRSHHIACLAAYLADITKLGAIGIITCSDPSVSTVAPFGGTRPLYTPNPIAFGIPTGGNPVIVDISTSSTANGYVNRCRTEGRKLPGKWLLDHQGAPTDDPNALFTDPPGSILPLGGADLGYKGFALALMVEAITQGLGGHGRADDVDRWGASTFIQIINTSKFGGTEPFRRQTDWLAAACQSTPPREGVDRVVLPGERAFERKERQLKSGVDLSPALTAELGELAENVGIPFPAV